MRDKWRVSPTELGLNLGCDGRSSQPGELEGGLGAKFEGSSRAAIKLSRE